ncbi:hypothetical protein TNCV_5104861 [Trichonephila clavipes]|nr:hypothetical protein TNCV_5104861 [Trichonephila clavipes]
MLIGNTPAHPWYLGTKPRRCHQLNIPRHQQTGSSRFFSGHITSFTFQQGQKVFPECHRLEAYQAFPSQIFNCLKFTIDEVFGNPILFLDFFGDFWFYGDDVAKSYAIWDKKQQQATVCLIPPVCISFRQNRTLIKHRHSSLEMCMF